MNTTTYTPTLEKYKYSVWFHLASWLVIVLALGYVVVDKLI